MVDYLIIGQGIAGTWLSYYLQKENKTFLVIDDNAPNTSSKVAAGMINPVTGRRHATAWMAEELLPFAWEAYSMIGHELGITAISQKSVIDFFPTPQMRLSFLERVEEKTAYVHSYPEQNHFNHLLNYDFGCGEIRPVYVTHLEQLLPAWRKKLEALQALREEIFDISLLKVHADHITYDDIKAQKIIFCDGNKGADNPCFSPLPFAPNKGELLLLSIPDLPPHHVYKKSIMLVPLAAPGSWWAGPSYEWDFADTLPTAAFREKTEKVLKEWLKVPFTVTDHLAGMRPATLERRPFVGLHPHYPAIGILNGMGTKGCSLAPFFAKEFTDHLLYKTPLTPAASVDRFSKILSRT